jgi:hypothetical protein
MAISAAGIQTGVTLASTNQQRKQRRETPRNEGVMPARKRKRRERTHDWHEIQQATLWPEQEAYERLRPIVLFGETAAERAKETGGSPRTLHYQARRFEQEGMASLFPKPSSEPLPPGLKLPPEMCQLIVNLEAEYPGFSLREISTICYLCFGRNLSHQYVIGVEERDGTNSLRGLLIYSILRHTKRSVQYDRKPTHLSYGSTPRRLGKSLPSHRR